MKASISAGKISGMAAGKMIQSYPSIPPEPPVTPEFDTVDFNDTDFETGETT